MYNYALMLNFIKCIVNLPTDPGMPLAKVGIISVSIFANVELPLANSINDTPYQLLLKPRETSLFCKIAGVHSSV